MVKTMAEEKKTGTTEQITDIRAFASAVKQILEQTNPSVIVEIHEVSKNNSLKQTCIAIQEKDRNIAPTIYLEEFFGAYRDGKPLDEICRVIEEIHRKASPEKNFDTGSIAEFSSVKDKICYKLVNAEKNADRLKEVPHRLWQDLAVVYFVPVSIGSVYEVSSFMVGNGMMEKWGVDEDTLYEHARMNTPVLFNAEILSMAEVVKNMFREMAGAEGEMAAEDLGNMQQLYIATNDRRVNGAIVMLYDGMLEKIAGQIGGSFYILPSSIHEIICQPVLPSSDGHRMVELVRNVNASGRVAPEEVLSDNVYIYHAGDGSITLIG